MLRSLFVTLLRVLCVWGLILQVPELVQICLHWMALTSVPEMSPDFPDTLWITGQLSLSASLALGFVFAAPVSKVAIPKTADFPRISLTTMELTQMGLAILGAYIAITRIPLVLENLLTFGAFTAFIASDLAQSLIGLVLVMLIFRINSRPIDRHDKPEPISASETSERS
ncbi:hypothetical protein ACFELO_09315 [Oceanicaulis sp. LC35]|uniref:hypothetical protein n=1 Tax=Oceanicaulis sp. LC35 TaxID=3349635 RepID=UPI003F82B2EF